MRFPCLLMAVCTGFLTAPAGGQFAISLSFDGTIAPDQQAVFEDAAEIWEGYIVGYQPGISLGGIDVTITDAVAIDGLGGALIGASQPDNAFLQGGYIVASQGTVQFDPADLGLVNHMELLLHATREIGHVLGFGTLWTINGLHTPGTDQYLGSAGIGAYIAEFDPTAAFIPVELGSPDNITNSHWDEIDFGLGLTGITDARGRDFANGLMTGWIAPDPRQSFISETTVMSFQDLGYRVQFVDRLLPEPSTFLLFHLAALVLFARRHRR